MKRLEAMEAGRAVRRYHTEQMHEYQRIDAHSWGVAMIVDYLMGADHPTQQKLITLQAALRHDLAEYKFGDVPAPAKRALGIRDIYGEAEDEYLELNGWPMPPNLLAESRRVLKIGDCVDGVLHCIAERRRGNKNVAVIRTNYLRYLNEELQFALGPWDTQVDNQAWREYELHRYLLAKWSEANER